MLRLERLTWERDVQKHLCPIAWVSELKVVLLLAGLDGVQGQVYSRCKGEGSTLQTHCQVIVYHVSQRTYSDLPAFLKLLSPLYVPFRSICDWDQNWFKQSFFGADKGGLRVAEINRSRMCSCNLTFDPGSNDQEPQKGMIKAIKRTFCWSNILIAVA